MQVGKWVVVGKDESFASGGCGRYRECRSGLSASWAKPCICEIMVLGAEQLQVQAKAK